MQTCWTFVISILFLLKPNQGSLSEKEPPISVAIIGGGIGGASSAYYLRQELKDNVDITLFEQDVRLGGRIENVSYDTAVLEIGASILYTGNKHLKSIVDSSPSLHAGPPIFGGGRMGIWDGHKLVYESSNITWLNFLKLLWRYGFFPLWRLRRLVRNTLVHFMQIYSLQNDACQAFETPQALWEAVGLYNLTQIGLREYLNQENIASGDSLMVRELVGSVNRVNYNQDNSLNALAGLVSLCPTVTGEVWGVKEGNAQMSVEMIADSQCLLHLNTTVSSLQIVSDTLAPRRYRLLDNEGSELGRFDAVVVATPFALSELTIKGQDDENKSFPPHEYVITHATFIEGSIRKGIGQSYFAVLFSFLLTCILTVISSSKRMYDHYSAFFRDENSVKSLPSSIFVEEAADVPISSLSLHIQLNETHGIYKLFSSEMLEEQFLNSLFISHRTIFHREWHAYPDYEDPPKDFIPFIVKPDENIYYVNSLETAVSAMEISAISAKNIALLIAKKLFNGISTCSNMKNARVDEL